MKLIITFALILLSPMTFAEFTLPDGCKPIQVKGEEIAIPENKESLVYIHNLTKNDLWLTHPESNPEIGGTSSRLQGSNWSALSVNKGPFAIHCIESTPGHEQKIPCENAVALCQWNNVKMPATAKGNFWAAEDQSLAALTTTLGTQGFVLPGKDK